LSCPGVFTPGCHPVGIFNPNPTGGTMLYWFMMAMIGAALQISISYVIARLISMTL
jgi:hypothetical protein